MSEQDYSETPIGDSVQTPTIDSVQVVTPEVADPAVEYPVDVIGKTVTLLDGQTGVIEEEQGTMVLLNTEDNGVGWQHRENIASVA